MGGRRPAWWLLGAVAATSFLLQVTLLDLERPPGWDEAVYLSQMHADAEPGLFSPSRARGIVWLVAPLTLAGAPVPVIRATLAAAMSLGLFLAFSTWIRPLGVGAAVAAFAFGFSWLGLFYGPAVMPNLPAALLAVAAAGLAIRALTERLSSLWGATIPPALLLFAVTLVRPSDALWLTAALGLAALGFGRMRGRRLAVAVGVGAAAGWVAWAIEAWVDFGSPIVRWQRAARLAGSGIYWNPPRYLALTEGPVVASPDALPPIPPSGVAWWGTLLALSLVALLRPPREDLRLAVRVAGAGAAALLFPSLFLAGGSLVAPRFLLPGLALLGIAAVAGAWSLLTLLPRAAQGWAPVVALVSLAIIAPPWGAQQATVARAIDERERVGSAHHKARGLAVRAAAAGRLCAFAYGGPGVPGLQPAVQFSSGCAEVSWDWRAGPPPVWRLVELREEGRAVFILSRRPLDPPPAGWQARLLEPTPGDSLILYEPEDQAGSISGGGGPNSNGVGARGGYPERDASRQGRGGAARP